MIKRLLLASVSIIIYLIPAVCQTVRASHIVSGKVVDASDGAPLPSADILVTDLEDRIITYGASDSLGIFSIGNIPSGEVLVLVRMMGYDTFVSDKLSFSVGSPERRDLGVISLARTAEGLREVTVTGEKNRIVYKLDRQQISASSSVTASGGTAVDILSGLPSVLVDSDGNLPHHPPGTGLTEMPE